MPMSFPTMKSLSDHAARVGFRPATDGETEEDYRRALSRHVAPLDPVEAHEIATGKGWDNWTDDEFHAFVRFYPEAASRNPMARARMARGRA